MLRDANIIANLYRENVGVTTPATVGQTPTTAVGAAATTSGEANEVKTEKQLPEDNWIRFKHILKSDADMDEAAVKIARLLDNVCIDRATANEIVRLVRVKNRKFNK